MLKESLLDTIVDFIAKRKVDALTTAFIKNQKLVGAIKDLNRSYKQMELQIDDYCKRYPEACKRAEEKKKAAGL